MKNIIIFGTGSFAEIAYEYLSEQYNVVAFTVDRQYLKETEKYGKPVVAFDEVERLYPPKEHEAFAALVYGHLNRDRTVICDRLRQKGYYLGRYISPHAFIHKTAEIGQHVFIFEDNTVQPFVKIGNNVIIWSGCHIGHHSVINENTFIASHIVISGHCKIHSNCFIGVNATIGNDVELGANSWVSPGAIITKDVPHNSLVKSVKSEVSLLNEGALFRALEK